MAILTYDGGQYEVRIKRSDDGTYFDEYAKTIPRQLPTALECNRYIAGEAGVAYTIEVMLKKGFNFGQYTHVRAGFKLPGMNSWISMLFFHRPSQNSDGILSDIVKELRYSDIADNGQQVTGATFTFKDLIIDENLENESDLVTAAPKGLGYFEILIMKSKQLKTHLNDEEYAVKLKAAAGPLRSSPAAKRYAVQHAWDAQKVDKKSFKLNGISLGVGLVDGHYSTNPPIPSRTDYQIVESSQTLHFNIHYCAAEYLESQNIIKSPPPLWSYQWNALSASEQRAAFDELQSIYMARMNQAQLSKKSGNPADPVEKVANVLKCLQPWSELTASERPVIFNQLKLANKSRAQGSSHEGTQKKNEQAIKREPSEIIIISDDDSDIRQTQCSRFDNLNVKPRKDKIKKELRTPHSMSKNRRIHSKRDD